MLPAIDFDHQPGVETNKIRNIKRPIGTCLPEFKARKTPVA